MSVSVVDSYRYYKKQCHRTKNKPNGTKQKKNLTLCQTIENRVYVPKRLSAADFVIVLII